MKDENGSSVNGGVKPRVGYGLPNFRVAVTPFASVTVTVWPAGTFER